MSEGSATALLARQFEMTDEDFAALCELVHRHAGIALSEAKRDLVYGRLSRRLRRLNLASFREYCELLESGVGGEVQEFVNAITTNLTAFFREPHHFEHLAREVLPALLRTNLATRRIRIWSAGCSSGEEAYSIAMTIREVYGELPGWDVRVLATDLDSNVVATARAGVYPLDRLEKIPVQRRERFFKPAGDAARVAPEVTRLVTFRQLNLIESWPMRGPFDAIFCRNVVIYFDKETQRTLFERFAHLQAPGAHLYIGHSETLFRITERYELIGKSTWRRLP